MKETRGRTARALFALLLATPQAIAAPAPIPSAAPRRPPPLAALPSIPRVRIDVALDHVLVTEDVDLPRGDWRGGDLDVYVAFGSPGAPEAFDAHLLPVADAALEPEEADAGTKLTTDRAPRRPAAVHALVGPEEMAGVVVHVPESVLRHAFAPGGMAAFRFRTLLHLPEGDAAGGREVLVRLGQEQSTPLTLGRVHIASVAGAPPIARAEARLCGRDADPWPLAVAVFRPGSATQAPAVLRAGNAPVAPVLAVRHMSDDLCVRFWPAPAP